MIDLAIRLTAEFLGSLLLVLTIMATGGSSIITGVVFGFIVFLIGNLSGGFVNPAISFALYLSGSIPLSTFIGYSIVQCLGAFTAVYTYNVVV